MIDQSEWLHRLGSNRPRHAAALTQDILDRTGPPPLSGAGGLDRGTHFLAVRLVPVLADDLCRRAALRTRQLGLDGASQAELDDAAAEARFWAHVRDWAQSWGEGAPTAYVPAARLVRIPRQVRHSS